MFIMDGHTSEQVPEAVINLVQSTDDFPPEYIEFCLSGQKFSVLISRNNNLFDCCLGTCVGDVSYSCDIKSSDKFDEALGELKKFCAPKQK